MTTILCHSCAANGGHLDGMVSSSLLSTAYQQKKHTKHTTGASGYPLTSIFTDPSVATYEGYFVSASVSGTLEIEPSGRKNLIVFADKTEGALFVSGSYQHDQASVKVVLYTDPQHAHGFATSSAAPVHWTCSLCGGPAPH